MIGLKEHPGLLERFTGREKLMPPSVERLNRILDRILELLAVSSSQTTKMLPTESTAVCGVNEPCESIELFEILFGGENTCARAGVHSTAKPRITIATM